MKTYNFKQPLSGMAEMTKEEIQKYQSGALGEVVIKLLNICDICGMESPQIDVSVSVNHKGEGVGKYKLRFEKI